MERVGRLRITTIAASRRTKGGNHEANQEFAATYMCATYTIRTENSTATLVSASGTGVAARTHSPRVSLTGELP
jgi:hypothetical protein